MPQYLVIRTDRRQKTFIRQELEAGRLRQGWGWKPEQDLRSLRGRVASHDKDEADAWRNRRLLDAESDGLKPGDIVIVPNIPRQGRWVLARVTGPYRYDPPPVGANVPKDDYGHLVPVEAIRARDGKLAEVAADNEHVDARLRASMRSPSRMWSVDALGAEVEALIAAINRGDDTTIVQSKEQKVAKLVDALHNGKSALKTILSLYRGAEFEHLVHHVFGRLYPGADVERKGGPGEHGADLLVTMKATDGLLRKIAVQVKLHVREDDDLQSLHQIKRARSKWEADEGIIVTTAATLSARFIAHQNVLAKELGIEIRVITLEEFTRLLMIHLAGVDSREWTP